MDLAKCLKFDIIVDVKLPYDLESELRRSIVNDFNPIVWYIGVVGVEPDGWVALTITGGYCCLVYLCLETWADIQAEYLCVVASTGNVVNMDSATL